MLIPNTVSFPEYTRILFDTYVLKPNMDTEILYRPAGTAGMKNSPFSLVVTPNCLSFDCTVTAAPGKGSCVFFSNTTPLTVCSYGC